VGDERSQRFSKVNDSMGQRTDKQLIVRCEHDRTALVEVVPKSVEKVVPRVRVLAERRFVQQKDSRCARERGGYCQSTALSAAQTLRVSTVHSA
jgi:hypothetical protein